jgi:hypothetical protein
MHVHIYYIIKKVLKTSRPAYLIISAVNLVVSLSGALKYLTKYYYEPDLYIIAVQIIVPILALIQLILFSIACSQLWSHVSAECRKAGTINDQIEFSAFRPLQVQSTLPGNPYPTNVDPAVMAQFVHYMNTMSNVNSTPPQYKS